MATTSKTAENRQGGILRTLGGESVAGPTRTGTRIATRSVHVTDEVEAAERAAGRSLLDRIKELHGDGAVAAIQDIAAENLPNYPQYTSAQELAENVFARNYYARMEAVAEIVGMFGLERISEEMTPEDLVNTAWVIVPEGGSIGLFGSGASIGEYRGSGDGRFVYLIIKGRQGGTRRTDGTLVPHKMSIKDPNVGAEVESFSIVEVQDEDGQVIDIDYEQTPDNMPQVGRAVKIKSERSDGRTSTKITSQVLQAYYLPDPEREEELFAAFSEASEEINRRTLEVAQVAAAPHTPGRVRRPATSTKTGEEWE